MTTHSLAKRIRHEVHRVRGEQLLPKVLDLARAANTRRIIVKTTEGHTILEIPLALGVTAALLSPTLVAIAAIAALTADYTVVGEKQETEMPGSS